MIRWAGVSALAIVLLIVFLISLIFTDKWFEETFEETASVVNQARVDVDDFHISFLNMRVSWGRVQVTDPKSTMKNRLDIGRTSFDLQFWPLLSNKYIINELEIDSVQFNTDRKTDGRLDSVFYEESVISSSINYLKKESSEFVSERATDVKANVNVESLIPKIEIKAISKIKSLQAEVDSSTSALKQQINSADFNKRFNELKATVNQISFKNMKDINQIKSTINAMSKVKNDIAGFESDYKELKKSTEHTLSQLKSLQQIEAWISEDYSNALKQAKLPDFSVGTIAKTLFGSGIYNQYQDYLKYLQLYEEYSAYFETDEVKKEPEPERLKGQTIHFYKRTAEPDFWIKKIKLSVRLEDGTFLEGSIKDIVSDQRQINKTTRLDMSGTNAQGSHISLRTVFDRLKETASDTIHFRIDNFPIRNYRLSRSNLFPEQIQSATGDFQILLNRLGDEITGVTKIDANDVVYRFSQSNETKTKALIEDIFSGIKLLKIEAGLRFRSGKPDISIKSNLDKALADGLKQSANKEFEKIKQQIRAKLDAEINPAKNKFLSQIGASQSDVRLILDQLEGKKGSLDQLYQNKKKDLNAKLEAEKKKLGFIGASLLKGLKIE
ncbi:MAG: TIGR03545 family protein [Calditrichaeota bacterium]|nr:TIGR03545 family protein [Calditrichota bacterium]